MEFVIKEFVIMQFVIKEFVTRESVIKESVIMESNIMESVIRELLTKLPINWLDYYDWMWKLIIVLVIMEHNMVLIIYERPKLEEDKTTICSHLG